MLLKRVLMSAATAFLAVNLWTGAPLFALWAGSQVVGGEQLTIQAVFVVIVVLGGLGISILSTPHGLMTGREAFRRSLGGEVVCYIW